MKKYFTLIVIFSIGLGYSQPNFEWAKSMGGLDQDYLADLAVDANNNLYVCGSFFSPTFFANPFSLPKLSNTEAFLAKYDQQGEIQWLRGISGSGHDYAKSVAVDIDGNVYVLGNYGGTLTVGSFTLATANNTAGDLFLLKYSPSGTPLWLKRIYSPSVDFATSLVIGHDGNLIISGGFQGLTLQLDDLVLNNANTVVDISDMFLIKLDPNGNVIWGRREGGLGSDIILDVQDTSDGSIYVTGHYGSQSMTVGSQTVTNGSNQLNTWIWNGDIFVIKYDMDGNPSWLQAFQGPAHDYGALISVDSANNIIVSGNFNTNVTFGSTQLSGTATPIFLLRLNSQGEILSAQSISSGNMIAKSMEIGPDDNIYFAASYTNQGTLLGATLPNVAINNYSISKITPDLNLGWSKTGGAVNAQNLTIMRSNDGSLFTALNFLSETLSFDEHTVTNANWSTNDIAIAKTESTNLSIVQVDDSLFSVYPNPTENVLYVNGSVEYFELFDINGRKLCEYRLVDEIDLSEFSSGIYLLKAKNKIKRIVKL